MFEESFIGKLFIDEIFDAIFDETFEKMKKSAFLPCDVT